MDGNGCQRLANAIIIQASKEYRSAMKMNKKKTISEIEEFFHSSWYETLTTIPGDVILDGLRKEASENDE